VRKKVIVRDLKREEKR